MRNAPRLKRLLEKDRFPKVAKGKEYEARLKKLQLRMLRVQQGIWHQKQRAIIVFEGFDAAGKGGAIRRLTELLDPRGFQVHPIGPPTPEEQGRHYLYRFWKRLPGVGTIAIFDRSWYGRVLVEKVESLTPPRRIDDAYEEIREFERTLADDGVVVIKIFLAIDKKEQLKRFEERLSDPYKQWKLTPDDVEARAHWSDYVKAADRAFEETHAKHAPWHLIAANDKDHARIETLEIVTEALAEYGSWMESKAARSRIRSLQAALDEIGVKKLR